MYPGLHRPSPHAFGRAERAGLRGSGSLKSAWNAAEPDEVENKPKTTTGEDLSKLLAASKLEDYQLDKNILVAALKEMGFTLEDVNVELFATQRQHVLDLYCSPGMNSAYKFYWAALGLWGWRKSRPRPLGTVPAYYSARQNGERLVGTSSGKFCLTV